MERRSPEELSEHKKVFALFYPTNRIYTDTKRFQNREAEFSEESVQRIVEGYDPNKLDPITVWKDPANGRVYVLSGHSRLEAHRRLQLKEIPARFFKGSEEEAIAFAKVHANRGTTAESLLEDIKAYKLLRDGDRKSGVEKQTQAELKKVFGNRLQKLEAYAYLNPKGLFLQTLNDPNVRAQFPYIENKATWVGQLRKAYPNLSDAHENELFDYLFKVENGLKISKDDFLSLMQRKLSRLDFDPREPLLLDKDPTTGTDARADTRAAQQRLYDIEKELADYRKRLKEANTAEEKAYFKQQITDLEEEYKRTDEGIRFLLRNQASLFGNIKF